MSDAFSDYRLHVSMLVREATGKKPGEATRRQLNAHTQSAFEAGQPVRECAERWLIQRRAA